MVNEYLTRAYDTKVIFRELLCFYAPFGWVPVKENRAPSPNAPVHKMYDGNTVWSMEKQDFVSDYDVGRKRNEKIVVKRSTKFTRNNRLMTEEALMEYHLRFRYWIYPRCNKLRLINRCRPGWGSLWALLFLAFLFFTLTIAIGAPQKVDFTYASGQASCKVESDSIYSLSMDGPFYSVSSQGTIAMSKKFDGKYTVLSSEIAEKYGVAYDNGRIRFSKDVSGKELQKSTTVIYQYPEKGAVGNFFVKVYNAFVYKAVLALDKAVENLFMYLCIGGTALFGIFVFYQIHSNLFLKKNTERIIECCINGKAIVRAMQYEDITLMNGRQRQRYYQGQVINEAARNTGDPLYFGS